MIFIFGLVLGRWTAPETSGQNIKFKKSSELANPIMPPISFKKDFLVAKERNTDQSANQLQNQKQTLTLSNKHMHDLYNLLIEASEKDDPVEQNKLLGEMESLDPKNEMVFQAKAMILQDEDNWDGAHRVLEECVATLPKSIICLRRLTNIRSSTIDDKLHYGTKCLQLSKNDPHCLIDVALALNSKGEFAKAKNYFEIALALPQNGEGYYRDYILYSYAFTLEGLNMFQKATEALKEACKLKNKAACGKLKV